MTLERTGPRRAAAPIGVTSSNAPSQEKRTLRREQARQGIRVNALVPGTTDTPFLRKAAGMETAPDAVWRVGLNQWTKSNVPGLGRLATAEEIAAFALTLASDEHPFMTGAQLVIDGGKTAKAG